MLRYILPCVLLLSGCGEEKKIKQFVAKIKTSPVQSIGNLPQIKTFKAVTYTGLNARSPFQYTAINSYNMSSGFGGEGLDVSGFNLNGNRRKGVLESYPINSYSMHGFMRYANTIWGLVRDPKGTIYHVEVGGFLGDNYGKITSITENKIVVEELLLDAKGEWHKKPAVIVLSDKISAANAS